MKDINIKVYDKQTYETHDDTKETEFQGQLAFRNESVYITYKDDEMSVSTIIKTKNGIVSVKRQGALKGNLEFDTEKPHTTIYYTPYGEMEIQIITKKCEVYILEKGIKIYIEYKILMQGKLISDNIYMIVAN
ncbi:DUF1934 domain-containing protein [Cellulosilyticum sp. I15G10I2]|uniref:DUF1934 domain-containing protein n=1 Tax=Cellulosilyticum sp. I15G10I2 TaxID=1892843 RepID=UPI00085C8D0B|nr:DUF1934 domain-containing protein [Cellulosilyticum sp. I15G10I2]